MDREMIKQESIQAVQNFFEANDWPYEYNEEKAVFRAVFNLDTKLSSIRVLIIVTDTGISFIGGISSVADQSCRLQVAEYLTWANYGLRNGCFEMDMRDGEIRYRTFCPTFDGAPSQDTVEYMLVVIRDMFKLYGNELLAVMFGMKTPQEAVEAAKQAAREG